MTSLAQFLSLIASDISKAKTMSDLSTARLSTKFLKDDFLRLLPITRIDIDQVNLKFKMGIGKIRILRDESPFLKDVDDKISASMNKIFKSEIASKKISIQTISDITIKIAVESIMSELTEQEPSHASDFTSKVSNQFCRKFFQQIKKVISNNTDRKQGQIENEVKMIFTQSVNNYINLHKENVTGKFIRELECLDIVVESQQLRDLPSDSLVELQFQLTPKSFHWSLKPEYIEKTDAPPEDRYSLMPG